MASACSTKWPPKFENEDSYEVWKNDMKIWCLLTDLDPKKQALAIHLSLSGRARTATSELKVETLNNEKRVEKVLEA